MIQFRIRKKGRKIMRKDFMKQKKSFPEVSGESYQTKNIMLRNLSTMKILDS